MTTMNISLPEELKAFVDQQVGSRGYTSSSEYVRELIRREQDKERLRALLLEGLSSPLSGVVADKAYFDGLRARIREWSDERAAARPSAAGADAVRTQPGGR
jgi:antitoxin ParD1/3/4